MSLSVAALLGLLLTPPPRVNKHRVISGRQGDPKKKRRRKQSQRSRKRNRQ